LELPQAVKASVPLLADLRESSAKGDGGKDGEKPFAIELLPTKDVPLYTSPPAVLDRVDATSISTWVTRFVPFPSSAYPGQRWVVNLLNGTSDKGVVRKVAPRIVEAGGSIGLTGNASSFDIEKSRVEYVTEDARTAAETVAAQFGISPTKVDLMPSGIDVTVVVGKDLL
ncbi:MAG TPA: LytR C-terminal domain-containing protein, partial [Microthrixaceae bacterium]|nr:LytR C-terminal domain-containing protein [Microthrixaceae bacterium]